MSSVTVPKGSIVCLMCRGAIPFENRGSFWFKKHLQKNHEIHFNYELYIAINLLGIESIKTIIRDHKQSGKLSEFTSREDDPKEVFDVEDDGAAMLAGPSTQFPLTSMPSHLKEEEEDPKAKLYDCGRCGEKYTYNYDKYKCEQKHREEDKIRREEEKIIREKEKMRREEELKVRMREEEQAQRNVCPCGEKYARIEDMIRCVNRHKEEDERREAEQKAERERRREEKRKSRKRKMEALLSEEEQVALDPLAKRKIVNESDPDSVSYSSRLEYPSNNENDKTQKSSDKSNSDILERIDSLTSVTIQAKSTLETKMSSFDCDQCNQSFNLKMKLNRHKKTAHPIACEDCGEIFKTEELRDSHRETAHPPPQMSAIEMEETEVENSLSSALTLALAPPDETPTLDENPSENVEVEDSESNLSLQFEGNKSYEEIINESEYFQSKPGQARKVSAIDHSKFTDELTSFPKGWFYRMSSLASGRNDKEFLYAQESVIFRSRKAAVEYAKCLYGPEIVNNL